MCAFSSSVARSADATIRWKRIVASPSVLTGIVCASICTKITSRWWWWWLWKTVPLLRITSLLASYLVRSAPQACKRRRWRPVPRNRSPPGRKTSCRCRWPARPARPPCSSRPHLWEFHAGSLAPRRACSLPVYRQPRAEGSRHGARWGWVEAVHPPCRWCSTSLQTAPRCRHRFPPQQEQLFIRRRHNSSYHAQPTVHMWPSMHKSTIHCNTFKFQFFFAYSSYHTFADNDSVFLFSIRLIVLRLYDGKCDTVENVHFEECPFPIPYLYSVYQ